jgi:hypothetical protein
MMNDDFACVFVCVFLRRLVHQGQRSIHISSEGVKISVVVVPSSSNSQYV